MLQANEYSYDTEAGIGHGKVEKERGGEKEERQSKRIQSHKKRQKGGETDRDRQRERTALYQENLYLDRNQLFLQPTSHPDNWSSYIWTPTTV